ncbi:hypothetical protein Pan161_39310 [Gimesia algae]|uniref:Uncharacterized protein n=1 Tax=Gimesia algae TaxID=2527971 RepID=A0A517VGX5_9PLAN|nr:hypothetical protein Pan161_39310 [Gimesia algae]
MRELFILAVLSLIISGKKFDSEEVFVQDLALKNATYCTK